MNGFQLRPLGYCWFKKSLFCKATALYEGRRNGFVQSVICNDWINNFYKPACWDMIIWMFNRDMTSLVERAMHKIVKPPHNRLYVEVLQHLHTCQNLCKSFKGREQVKDTFYWCNTIKLIGFSCIFLSLLNSFLNTMILIEFSYLCTFLVCVAGLQGVRLHRWQFKKSFYLPRWKWMWKNINNGEGLQSGIVHVKPSSESVGLLGPLLMKV